MRRTNTGVKGLGNKLVPIPALKVRVCRYDASAPSTVVTPPWAVRLEAETNALPTVEQPARFDCGPTNPPYFFVTFANNTQKVDVWEDNGCGFITNGVLTARTTTRWRNEMRHYTTTAATQTPDASG